MTKFTHFVFISYVILIGIAGVGCQSQYPLSQQPAHHVTSPVQYVPDAQEVSGHRNFEIIKQQKKSPLIALVLGSGGARGYAHIGVIDVLEKHGIKPDLIVGTSAGSIVGSIYASGKSAEDLKQIALDLKPNDVRDLTIGLKGFFVGKKVEDYINENVNNHQLQDLQIPMYVVATELKEGRKTVFNYGNTGQAVRASISIPSMFVPAKIGSEEYVDGGLVSPVPVETARDLGADIVIAVDILAQPMYTETSNVWGLFNQNINIMQNNIAKTELKDADIIIRPDLREKNHIFDVKGREQTIQAGVEAALDQLPEILKVLDEKNKVKDHHYTISEPVELVRIQSN